MAKKKSYDVTAISKGYGSSGQPMYKVFIKDSDNAKIYGLRKLKDNDMYSIQSYGGRQLKENLQFYLKGKVKLKEL